MKKGYFKILTYSVVSILIIILLLKHTGKFPCKLTAISGTKYKKLNNKIHKFLKFHFGAKCKILKKGKIFIIVHNDSLKGFILKTIKICPEIKGYRAHIPLTIIFNKNYKILKIFPDSNNEDTFQWNIIKKANFITLISCMPYDTLKKAAKNMPDSITGATVSAQAILKEIIVCYEYLMAKKRKKHIKTYKSYLSKSIYLHAPLLIMSILAIIYRNSKLRLLILSITLILAFIMPHNILIISIKDIYLFLLKFDLNIGLLIMILACFIFGRVYCGYLCPFGAFLEFIYLCRVKLLTQKFHNKLNQFSYVKLIIFCTLISASVFLNFDLTAGEPFNKFFSLNFDPIFSIYIFIILLASLKDYRFWCKYICPVGGFFKLLSIKPLLFKNQPCTKCNLCRYCIKNCEAVKLINAKIIINPSECFLDFICIHKKKR